MYEDKILVCKECGKEFTFTAGEQEFYAERGFQNEPQRQVRPPRLLQRVLRQDARAAGLILTRRKQGAYQAPCFCIQTEKTARRNPGLRRFQLELVEPQL